MAEKKKQDDGGKLKKTRKKPVSARRKKNIKVKDTGANADKLTESVSKSTMRPMSQLDKLNQWIQNQPSWIGNSIQVAFVIFLLLTTSVTVVTCLQTLRGLVPERIPCIEGYVMNQTGQCIELYKEGTFIAASPLDRSDADLVGCFDLYKSKSLPLETNSITVEPNKMPLWVKIQVTHEAYQQYKRGERSLMLKFKTPSTSGLTFTTHINKFSKNGLKEGWKLRIFDETCHRSPEIALCLRALEIPTIRNYGSLQKNEMDSFLLDLDLGIQKMGLGPYERPYYEKIVREDDPDLIPVEIWAGKYLGSEGHQWVFFQLHDPRHKVQLKEPGIPVYYEPTQKDPIKQILKSIMNEIIKAYPIEGYISDVIAGNKVELSFGSLAGTCEGMEFDIYTSAGERIIGRSVTITHTWPSLSLGTLDPITSREYSGKDRNAIRSLLVSSKKRSEIEGGM